MKISNRGFAGLLVGFLLALGLSTGPAAGARVLLSETALETTFCTHCLASGGEALVPPSEGEIEGPCGLAISPSGSLYVADYYHRVIDVYGVPTGALPAGYRSQIALPGANSTESINSLDSVCGLAVDSAGDLYGNEWHRGIVPIPPGEAASDGEESTGLAIDRSTNRLYVDDRTQIAEYALPYKPGDAASAVIGTGHLDDAYGLAASGGLIYAADAGDQSVKVFEPEVGQPSSFTDPLVTLSGYFTSLKDASLAVDPTNSHLLVVDNSQPGYEHPRAAVLEFDSPGNAFAYLGQLPGAPIFGAPSGIAIASTGRVIVTDGNSELSNAFLYGSYSEAGFSRPAQAEPTSMPISAASSLSPTEASIRSSFATGSPTTSGSRRSRRRGRHHRKHRHRLESHRLLTTRFAKP